MATGDRLDGWLTALIARHTQSMSRPEFLKAARALSARYVERRGTLNDRSPIDSAGKRAAFAALYSPLHAIAVRSIARELGSQTASISQLVDLGCGTGAASIGWSLAEIARPASFTVLGVDRDAWALGEASWNWRTLGIAARTRRQDLVAVAARHANDATRDRSASSLGVVLGWSANELPNDARASLLAALVALGRAGAAILIVEPLAGGVAPWWNDWHRELGDFDPRADVWRFDDVVPAGLAELREAAGFRGATVDARSLWIPPRNQRSDRAMRASF